MSVAGSMSVFGRVRGYGPVTKDLMLTCLVKNDDGWILIFKSSAIERYGMKAVGIMVGLTPEKAKAWMTSNSREGCLKKLREQKERQ